MGTLMAKARPKAKKSQNWKSWGSWKLVKLQEVEGILPGQGPVLEVKDQDGHEHQDAAHHGVDEELDGGVDAPLGIAPDADQQVHGDEHDFPENIEQEKVQGYKDPDHPGFQEEDADHELFDLILDVLPAGNHGDHGLEKWSAKPGRG